MKNLLFTLLASLAVITARSQTYFSANAPYNLSLSAMQPVSQTEVNNAFAVVSGFGIPFKYPQGGCESRAYAMKLLLDSMNLPNCRVWLFAPAKFKAGSDEALHIKDLNDKTKTISWAYHTAPVLLVKEQEKLDTLVFDPSINVRKPMQFREWLATMQGIEDAEYTFCPSKYYLFYTGY